MSSPVPIADYAPKRPGEWVEYPPDTDLSTVPSPDQPKPIDEIAARILVLTYGEMIEFADGISKAADGAITAETLPGILWKWATQ